jgi:hypothetical protein
MIDSMVADAKFMDTFIVLGVKPKLEKPGAPPCTLRLLLQLALIRMARSIALPGSGLPRLTQLPLSPAGVNLSRAAFVVLFVAVKKALSLQMPTP